MFGPTDGAFETAQNAGLIPTDPDGELSKNCKKCIQLQHFILTKPKFDYFCDYFFFPFFFFPAPPPEA